MTTAFFISETYLKDNSPLSGNIDVAELYPFAKSAEDVYIQEAIGTSLYDDLIAKINADSTLAGSPNELVLVKKLRDALLWYTCYDALPFIGTKIRNVGIVQQAGDNLTNASDSKEWALRKLCKEKGDFYLKRVQDYLFKYGHLFPKYHKHTSDQLYPNKNSPTPGLDIAFDKNNCTDHHNRIDTRFMRRYYND